MHRLEILHQLMTNKVRNKVNIFTYVMSLSYGLIERVLQGKPLVHTCNFFIKQVIHGFHMLS